MVLVRAVRAVRVRVRVRRSDASSDVEEEADGQGIADRGCQKAESRPKMKKGGYI